MRPAQEAAVILDPQVRAVLDHMPAQPQPANDAGAELAAWVRDRFAR